MAAARVVYRERERERERERWLEFERKIIMFMGPPNQFSFDI
jgi:hypothetical protein